MLYIKNVVIRKSPQCKRVDICVLRVGKSPYVFMRYTARTSRIDFLRVGNSDLYAC